MPVIIEIDGSFVAGCAEDGQFLRLEYTPMMHMALQFTRQEAARIVSIRSSARETFSDALARHLKYRIIEVQ